MAAFLGCGLGGCGGEAALALLDVIFCTDFSLSAAAVVMHLLVFKSISAATFTSLLALNSSLGWEEFKINLSSYVGSTVHVAFNSVSDYGSNNPYIDDIMIEELPTYPIAEVSTTELDFGEIAIASSKTLPFGVFKASIC